MDEWTSGFKVAIYSPFGFTYSQFGFTWTWDYTKGHSPSASDYFESPQYLKPRINVHTYIAGFLSQTYPANVRRRLENLSDMVLVI